MITSFDILGGQKLPRAKKGGPERVVKAWIVPYTATALVDSFYRSFVRKIMKFLDLKILQPLLNRLPLYPDTMSQYSVEDLQTSRS